MCDFMDYIWSIIFGIFFTHPVCDYWYQYQNWRTLAMQCLLCYGFGRKWVEEVQILTFSRLIRCKTFLLSPTTIYSAGLFEILSKAFEIDEQYKIWQGKHFQSSPTKFTRPPRFWSLSRTPWTWWRCRGRRRSQWWQCSPSPRICRPGEIKCNA